MATAVVSDLHLGTAVDADLARLPEFRDRLVRAVAGAERVVLLGDALELRERPVARVLELARPFFEALGHAAAGRRVTLVPGNHDYQLAEPWLAQERLDAAELPLESVWNVEGRDHIAGRIAAWMPRTEVTLAYPGLWLRPDVYATHGHYLDLHLTVPRLESIVASFMGRLTGRTRGLRTSADYEAVLAPLYALIFGLAQGASSDALRRGGSVSRKVWDRAGGRRGSRWSGFLLGRVTIPAGVAAMNRAGLGPFRSDLSGAELRRAGLRAMAAVLEGLAVDADHVVFGHTHRPGPLPGDDASEWTAGPIRLWNSGSWLNEPALRAGEGRRSPYWPGTVLRLADEGPPELEEALGDAENLPALAP